ncbi:MAG: RNA-binding protein [Spirochaetota bacterium]
MAKKIYVGNLPFGSKEEDLKNLFSQFGDVTSVKIITDRDTGRSRGFGFVEMDNAEAAINGLNGKDFGGRELRVNEAKEREPRRFQQRNEY